MSRCFPFPPPGYEKKTRTGDLDLLLKEKHKEKKHKKEKKDREKRESKDKKEDKSKEKHRDKDRKDRHKDKKRDKDKHRHKTADEQPTEERKGDERKGDDTPGKLVERNHGVQEKKIADEFIRRIKDDGRKAEDVAGKFNGAQQRRLDGTVRTKDIVVKEKSRENRIEGAERPMCVENKEKNKERRTEIVGWPKEDTGGKDKNKERQTEGIEKPRQEIVVKDKKKERQPEAIDKSKQYVVRKDYDNELQALGIHRPKEDVVSSKKVKEKQIEGTDRPKGDAISKEKAQEMQTMGIERHKADIAGKEKVKQRIEGINEQKNDVMGREKNKEKDVDTKKAKHKDKKQGREENSKSKDKKRDKEEEKKVEGIAPKQIEQKLGESGNKLQSGSFRVAAVYLGKEITNNAGLDPNTRKRKDLEKNGVFHDELRPKKLPRTASGATLQLENGCRIETVHNALEHTPDRQGEADKRKLGRVADGSACSPSPHNKDHKINGKLEPRLSGINLRPCASAAVVYTSTSGREPIRPPHPDSQYLNQILTVPKMPEWSDFDDQEWLFSDNNIQTKPSFQSEIDGTPQVWAEALHIEPADVHALPYVIPY